MPLKPYLKDQVRLFLVAVGIAVIALTILWASVVLIPQSYFEHINPKWGRFGFVTIVFLGYWLRMYWRARKDPHFWFLLAGILILHFVVVGYIFYNNAGLLLLIVAVAAETALLALAVYRFLGIGPPVRKH